MDQSNRSEIILFPDFVKLKKEVEKLRVQLSVLVLEHDELLYVECKNIEMKYMLTIGGLEYKAYEIECSILRLKRKVELIQMKKNRQEKVIVTEIENQLDDEFAEYEARLNKLINKMNGALERSSGQPLSKEESREIKKLYRAIVKSLHPDLNPDLSEAKIKLFHNAVNAYENGDLNGLRIIMAMLTDSTIPEEKTNGLNQLTEEKERLTKLLHTINNRILDVKSKYPYTMKSFIQNEEKTEKRKAELNATIKELNEVLTAYKAKIKQLVG